MRIAAAVAAVLLGAGLNPVDAGAAPDFEWVLQFGTSELDGANAVAVDASGVYVTGSMGDAQFLQKRDAGGNVLWTRQFGISGFSEEGGLAVDATGVYAAGAMGDDALLMKYDRDGNVLWTREFGTPQGDRIFGTAVHATDVFVAGPTYGAFPGETNAGSADVFLRKYDGGGNVLWTREFGTSDGDYGLSLAVDAGGAYVAGLTYGTFPGETSAGVIDAFLGKYDLEGNQLWTRQFGCPDFDEARGVAVDATGVYVAGEIGPNAFLDKYDGDGNILWTREFGTSGLDRATSVALDGMAIYVAGETYGAFPGETNAGSADAFVRKHDPEGNAQWTRQVGTPETDIAEAVVVEAGGAAYVAGVTQGTLPGQTSAGGDDGFLAKLSPTPSRALRFDLHPDTLNLRSRGRWVTAYLVAEDTGARDIDPRSLSLNGIPVSWTRVLDEDALMAKFDRAAFGATLSRGDVVVVTLTGRWSDGSSFVATDTIRVT